MGLGREEYRRPGSCANTQCLEAGVFKAPRDCNGGECVEVAVTDVVRVRDTKNDLGDAAPVLEFSLEDWETLLEATRGSRIRDGLESVAHRLGLRRQKVGAVSIALANGAVARLNPNDLGGSDWGRSDSGTTLSFNGPEMLTFRKSVRAGDFNLPAGPQPELPAQRLGTVALRDASQL